MIRFLAWDSQFFGKKIYRVDIQTSVDRPEQWESIIHKLKEDQADGAYIILSEKDPDWESRLQAAGIRCEDEKVIFAKAVNPDQGSVASDDDIEDYHGKLTDDLLALSWEAGKYSRFRSDEKLLAQFKPLYKKWIENSLSREIADLVLVCQKEGKIIGMLTAKKKESIATIGLIATDPLFQGKGIGRRLIARAQNVYAGTGAQKMEVATQLANLQACSFYESCGFHIQSVTPIYHIWFKYNDTI
ncbi:MAG: GNAT family N-acetyltransferase [Bacteroidetes bacterium]|nr:GNAT family N-acetyltransferase [Bacteroidota bacterium]